MDANSFSDDAWVLARDQLDGLPGGRGLNIAHEAVDRHCVAGHGARTAIVAIDRSDARTLITYDELRERSARFASALGQHGVAAGQTVFMLMPRRPEFHVAVLGALKARAVVCPLFPAFGPEPILQRMLLGEARMLVTTPALYERRIRGIRGELPALDHVVLVGTGDAPPPDGTVSFESLLAGGDPTYEIGPTAPEDPALLHFTSGTTGKPKGALHVHEAVVVHHASAAEVFGLHADDVFWCTADPGWVTGMSYGVIAPLTHGATLVVDEGELDADRWYGILERERVGVWYTAPTALRMLRRAGAEAAQRHDLGALRTIASVGEALDPATWRWAADTFAVPVLDTWWQTETGGIMIGNRAGLPVRPGSMGTALTGVTAAVLRADEEGTPRLVDGHPVTATADEPGHLALRAGWPSMFRTYLGAPERYAKCFLEGWYLSGDLARMDADGYVWFLGRSDDVIKSAGHLIGPNEVESVLLQHPDVVDAGVIGVPDTVAGEVVKAFVTLRAGVAADDEDVLRSVLAHARRHLGAAIAPREIVVSNDIPKTKSGKILRRLLRARELGLPEGDLSTLEPAS
ncbi:MAG: acetate--CoA ligase [Acidimicrobiia bacterium]